MKIIKEIDKKELKDFLYNINIEDPALYEELENPNSIGIFQLNGKTAQRLSNEVKPKNFEDTCAVLSLARPGPIDVAAPFFIERKKGAASPYPEAVNDILKTTYGTFVYQEQIMEIFHKIGGFSLEETNCLTGDMLITTNIGKIKLNEIVKNKLKVKVLSYNEKNNKFEWKNINNYFDNGRKELIEIELENGEKIKCTPEHKIFTKNRGWVEAKNLTEKDELIHKSS